MEFWIHHLSDASDKGYGQVSFIKMVNCVGVIHYNFIMGKARVTQKKYILIPRLELVTAMLSVKFLSKKLNIDCLQNTFWSDSKVILGYIRNTTKKFKIFAANESSKFMKIMRSTNGDTCEVKTIQQIMYLVV